MGLLAKQDDADKEKEKPTETPDRPPPANMPSAEDVEMEEHRLSSVPEAMLPKDW